MTSPRIIIATFVLFLVIAGSLGGVYWYQQSHSSSQSRTSSSTKTEKTLQQLALTRAAALLGVSEGEAGDITKEFGYIEKDDRVWYEKKQVEQKESPELVSLESWSGTSNGAHVYKRLKTVDAKILSEYLETKELQIDYRGGKYATLRDSTFWARSNTRITDGAGKNTEWDFLDTAMNPDTMKLHFEKVRQESVGEKKINVYQGKGSIGGGYYFVDADTGQLLKTQTLLDGEVSSQVIIVSHVLVPPSEVGRVLAFVQPAGVTIKKVLSSFSASPNPTPRSQFSQIVAKYALPIAVGASSMPDFVYSIFGETTPAALENNVDFDPNFIDSGQTERQVFLSEMGKIRVEAFFASPLEWVKSNASSILSWPITIAGTPISAKRITKGSTTLLLFEYQKLWYVISTTSLISLKNSDGTTAYPELPAAYQLVSPSQAAALDTAANATSR
jgi:hypothetical protein